MMNEDTAADVEEEQTAGNAPVAFRLKVFLAMPVWLALFFGLGFWLGTPDVVRFVLASCAVGFLLRPAWWCPICIVTGICSILAMPGVLPNVNSDSVKRSVCTNNLKEIGLALHNYHATYGCFPPAYVADEDGRPMHSWRVLILPFLDEGELYGRYDFSEPWDGPKNGKLTHRAAPYVFSCPANLRKKPFTRSTYLAVNTTSYLAVVGPGTAWPGTESTKLDDYPNGGSETILAAEVTKAGVHWMEPRDLNVEQISLSVNPPTGHGISSRHTSQMRAATILFADGRVDYLSEGISPGDLDALLRIDGEGVRLEE